MTPAIRFSGVSKRFPGVQALADVTFDVDSGSCHAVCGENGAGKSTLGKILAGIEQPESGAVELDGQSVDLASPRDALRAGIAMVHQELAFCENLTVAENLNLSSIPRRFGFVDQRRTLEHANELLAGIGATIDPTRRMGTLTVGEQQMAQIAAAVGDGARVIIFDEPTSSLGQDDANRLGALIATLKSRGVTIMYVSHRLAEIFAWCDTVTVLRDGRHVTTQPTSSMNEDQLVRQMIGRPVEQYFPAHAAADPGRERLRVDGLSSPGRLRDVSFAVRAGEVVGLAGLVGAGRSEIAQAIFGLDRRARGAIDVDGVRHEIRSPRDAMRHGIGFVPEDRKRLGLVMSMRSAPNLTLTTLSRHTRLGWIDRRRERATVDEQFARLHVRAAAADVPVSSLSGGNQQKIAMAKWLARDCDVLMLDEPTRGVDVGAKAELHEWIDRLAAGGKAILLISSELPELLALSTRILVVRGGRIVGEVARDEASPDALLRLMSGVTAGA